MSSSFKTVSNKELEVEILRLNYIYNHLIAWDHHKNRDCCFYIIQKFSYGSQIDFYIEHHGYINEYLDLRESKTWRAAAITLVELLRRIIVDQLEHYKTSVADTKHPFGYTEGDVKMMKELYQEYKDEFNV